MTCYLYARVSTSEQNIHQQIDLLKSKHQWDAVFADKASGKNLQRIEFEQLRGQVTTGDRIITQDLSRIGRNTAEVLAFIEEMTSRGVGIVIDDLGSVDVTSATGKMVVTTLAAVATMQREQILEKQRIGIERAKAEGKFKGRQRSPETLKKCMQAVTYIEQGLSKEAAARAANIGIATLYRHIKQLPQSYSLPAESAPTPCQ